ncbi:hypothetical protein D3C73_1448470 [compost metagenome]
MTDAPFADGSDISDWALDGIKIAYTLGIIEGRPDNTFGPADAATRAESMTMLKKFMDKLEL